MMRAAKTGVLSVLKNPHVINPHVITDLPFHLHHASL